MHPEVDETSSGWAPVATGGATEPVKAPQGTSSFDLVEFGLLLEQVLGQTVDLVEYGGLKPRLDDDVHREAVAL